MSKISVYVSEELDIDMKLYARHKGVKITELVSAIVGRLLGVNTGHAVGKHGFARNAQNFIELSFGVFGGSVPGRNAAD